MGVRTFMTGYDPAGKVWEWGKQDIGRIYRLCHSVDKLQSRWSDKNVRHKQRYQLRHHIINNSQRYQIRCLQGHSRRWGVHWDDAEHNNRGECIVDRWKVVTAECDSLEVYKGKKN